MSEKFMVGDLVFVHTSNFTQLGEVVMTTVSGNLMVKYTSFTGKIKYYTFTEDGHLVGEGEFGTTYLEKATDEKIKEFEEKSYKKQMAISITNFLKWTTLSTEDLEKIVSIIQKYKR